MRLRYITCSDPRENLNPKDVIDLLKISPLAELGVQAHPSAMSFGYPRFDWLKKLLDMAKDLQTPINLALHVNYKWCDKICMGKIYSNIDESAAHQLQSKSICQDSICLEYL